VIRPSKQRRCIALETIDDQNAQHLLELLHRAGLDVRVWDASSDVGVACIHCLLMEQNNGERNMQFADPEFGSGCHPDRSIALLRAVTEAIQARTTFIAGSRDDFQTKDYQSEARASRRNACLLLMQGNDCAVPFASVPHQHFDTLAEDVQWLLEQLMKVGIKEVPCLDLQLEQFNIPVARVIVPGLEGANNGNPDDYEPGARAKALVESQLSQPA